MQFSISILFIVVFTIGGFYEVRAIDFHQMHIVSNFTVNLVKSQQTIIFACHSKDLLRVSKILLDRDQLILPVNLQRRNYSLPLILTRKNHASTGVIVDCGCNGAKELIKNASELHFFNKTYQWLLMDSQNIGVNSLLPKDLPYFGPNAQVSFVNGSALLNYTIWDVHTKGRHLGAPLEMKIIAEYISSKGLRIINNIFDLQSLLNRRQFNGLKLRGVTVVDRDNITTNYQIEGILTLPGKSDGVASFVKYHYDLLCILRDHLNFTVNWRNTRAWAGRLANGSFRLGLLGVAQRDEADIVGSSAFNRINRFAEFDTIHQSWKFESAFLYRFTPDLDRHNDENGNFLAPFEMQVWLLCAGSLCVVNVIWRFIEWTKLLRLQDKIKVNNNKKQKQKDMRNKGHQEKDKGELQQHQQQQQKDYEPFHLEKKHQEEENLEEYRIVAEIGNGETSWSGILLKSFAAICQQGMEPIPRGLPSRTIILTVFLFSLVMYNYYTSSVVGGLLSSKSKGPETIDDVTASPLKLSFEDVGYYRVLFRERFNRPDNVRRLYDTKVLKPRSPGDLPLYTSVEEAIPYLKKGGYAFHCEMIDAYPKIAKLFDVDEICDLRSVSGLLEVEILNLILTKNSQYTEFFRIILQRSTETGLVSRIKRIRHPEKPQCQAMYRLFPISISGVSSAYMILAGGCICGLIVLFIERMVHKRTLKSNRK